MPSGLLHTPNKKKEVGGGVGGLVVWLAYIIITIFHSNSRIKFKGV